MPKLKSKVNQICHLIKDRNGFEVYRRINMEEDTVFANTDFRMEMEIRNMARMSSNNVTETRKHFMQLEARVSELHDKTDKTIY